MEALAFDFMRRAVITGAVMGLVCPAVGLFLVLRRLSLIGDTLAHVSLAGVAAGFLLKVYPLAAAFLLSVVAGVGIEKLRNPYRRFSDLAVAIAHSVAVALAVVLISLGRSFHSYVFAYLFGSIMTVTERDVLAVTALGAGVLLALWLLFKELFFITFDEELARSSGLPVRAVNVVFTVLTAAAIAVAMRVVGVILVSSLVVLPVAAALAVARSFRGALALSVAFAEAAVLAGLLAAYYLDLAPGGTVGLTAVVLLLTVLGLKLRGRAGRTCRSAATPVSLATQDGRDTPVT